MTSPVSVGDQPITRSPAPESARQPAAHARDRRSAANRPSAEPAVQLFEVTKRFGDVMAVDRMNLRIADGAFYSFLGPSGCGKTTTLRMIAGFEQPNEGRILLEGRPVQGVPPYRRNVNTVFQHYALFPHMSVAQNVGYGLRQRGAGKQDEMRRVGEMLDLVQLRGYERRRTWELSGGQQQRVALARALINRPAVLLLDEPLGALDRKLRHEMQIELKQIQHEVGITFVYVTHDQEEALTMSDTIVVMRDGRIQQEGAPQTLYLRPANRFVAGFIGSSNFIEAAVLDAQSGSDRARVRTERGLTLEGRRTDPDAAATTGDAVTVAIRPESILVGPRDEPPVAGAGWFATAGRVAQGTYLGDQTEYRIEIPDLGELIVRRQHQAGAQTQRTFGPGEDVSVAWHESSALVLMS